MDSYTINEAGEVLFNFDGSLLLGHQHSGPGDGGVLAVGVTDTDLTPGSVWFAGAGGLLQENNAKLFWDDGNIRFGIGTPLPAQLVDMSNIFSPVLRFTTTKNGAGWTGLNFGRLEFYSNDVSGPGVGIRGSIEMVAGNDFGAPSTLIFSTASSAVNDVETMRLEGSTQRVSIGGVAAPLGTLHVGQLNGSATIPALYLDQADVSEEMIQFQSTIGVGNAIEAVGVKTLTVTHFIKVTLPGALTRYFPVGTIA